MKDNPFKIQEGSVRDNDVGGFTSGREVGDHLDLKFLDKASRLGKFFDNKKIRNLLLIFSLFIFILLARSFYLQVIKGNDFRNIAEGNRIRSDIIPANRGLIHDRFGNLLVKNVSYFFLYLTPELLPTDESAKQELLNNIVETIGMEREDLDTKIEESNSEEKFLVYESLAYEDAIKLMVMSDRYPALQVSYESRRQYFPDLGLSHTLGYLGSVTEEDINEIYHYHDRIGKTGIELTYESILKGDNGVRQVEIDALFREKNIIAFKEPLDGTDIVLTIDSKAQEQLHNILSRNSRANSKPKMAAIVLDVSDGGILAISSLPEYDNNIFTTVLNTEDYDKIINDPNTPLLNRTIAGTYPLGSVFKTVVASAALEEQLIDERFTVNSTGGVAIGNSFFPDWRGKGHGLTNIYWALADSVNTYFYTIGGGNNQWLDLGLGVERIVDYAKRFGLGKLSGIDLNSEAPGFLPNRAWKQETFEERWFLGDTYNLAIGQGYLTATPLQGLMLMSYFANNGEVYIPHLIKEVKYEDSTEIYQPSIALTNIISSDNVDIIRRSLRDTVRIGTAQSMQSVPVQVAGKTGTAQFRRDKAPHSWFAGFAPYNDPKIAIIVLAEEGGDIGLAVTIARQFMEWYFSQ